MIKRVVEIGSECQLRVSNGQLIILQNGELRAQVPLDDLGVLVLDNGMTTYTLQLLQECADRNVAVIFCDKKHLPRSLMQPLWGHSLHSRTVAEQMTVSEPTRKRLWQAIVAAKIRAQALTLSRVGVEARYLLKCAVSVKSGDADNQESQAAAIYWKLLFGPAFRRNPDAEGINSLLNYCYAVVRACVARSVVGTGLHPAIGVHHHNQYDAFCLADDLMEPFRPAVDLLVYRIAAECDATGKEPVIDKDAKRKLLAILESKWMYHGKTTPFITVLQLFCAGFKRALLGETKKLDIPVIAEFEREE